MKILSNWLRSYLPAVPADDRKLAEDLTLRGIAVEGIFDLGAHGSVFDLDITTNRVDAMNHYGIASVPSLDLQATLVIPTGAKRSGGICGVSDLGVLAFQSFTRQGTPGSMTC